MTYPWNANEVLTAADLNAKFSSVDTNITTINNTMGLVLVKPTSATNGTVGANGAVTIGSAVSSVTVNGAFSSTYQNYQLVITINAASTNNDVLIQFGSSTTNYDRTRLFISSTPGSGTSVTEQQNQSAGYLGVNFSTYGGDIVADVFRPNDAAPTSVISNGVYRENTGAMQLRYHGTLHRPATAYTAFTVLSSTGTISGGTIRVYGYNNG